MISAPEGFVPRPRRQTLAGRGPLAPSPERDVPPRASPSSSAHRSTHALLGSLAAFAAPGVTDLLVNGVAGLWIDRGGGLLRAADWPRLDEDAVRELAVRLVAAGGRHIDEATPAVDVRLPGGVRVHAVVPPVAVTGTTISVRLAGPTPWRLDALRASGMVTAAQADRLIDAVAQRRNLLITGAAGTGKTSLLAALLAEAPPTERIVTIEDVAELRIDHPHVVGLEARQPNIEGAGALAVDRLLREALRMRPDRIVLGECRGAEIRELITALNTGHDGGAGTLHANSLDDVPSRLESLGALAGMSADAIGRQVASAIDLVVHLERRSGGRRIAAMGRPEIGDGGRLEVTAE
ncbi:TadA family conjugal transfer-associated ATPase [Naasia lichenicola]|uniref:TadA family conjugal transfer-associated ATPase n=1 Tax=Naasia lichenicola TaxID=2565933 RepID=UPI003F698645